MGGGWRRVARFVALAREVGVREAARRAALRLLQDPTAGLPLARADKKGMFVTDLGAVFAEEMAELRTSTLMHDASRVERSYPRVFEWEGRIMRYAFLPARKRSRGLVVLFHGHNAFMHMGPARRWDDFDLLAPWDTFGWKRQGSWFWGENGDNFVERIVQALIEKHRGEGADGPVPWFCMGGSMGGVGALYHGIKYGCDGIYALCPQVDLARKIDDYAAGADGNPYRHLVGDRPDALPDLLGLAGSRETLPPMFLIQYQYDHVNPFAEHGFRLLDVYNRKKAWYAVRVYPSIGHGGDGSQEEAELFFSLILDRHPPLVAEIVRGR